MKITLDATPDEAVEISAALLDHNGLLMERVKYFQERADRAKARGPVPLDPFPPEFYEKQRDEAQAAASFIYWAYCRVNEQITEQCDAE